MLDQQDPWLAIGDPVEHEPAHMPRIPAQSANTQAPAGTAAQPAPDAFSQVGQPVQPGDHSTATADAMEGGFADQQPETPKSKLSPEDEAHYVGLLHTGNASDIVQFLGSKGRSVDRDWLDKFIDARDGRRKNGGRVNYGVSYEFPDTTQLDQSRVGGGAGAMTRGAVDTMTLGLAPKIGAAVRALQDGDNGRTFGDNYNYEHDLGVGVRKQDHAEHPWTTISGQLLGGMALPAGLEGVGLKAGTDVLKAGGSMEEARAAVGVAVRNRMAAVSGGYGAAHGALSADTPGDALTGALTEGALGAATGVALPVLAPLIEKTAGAVAAPFRSAADLATGDMTGRTLTPAAQAFHDEGVPALPADVGGIFSRMATGVSNMTLGGIPIGEAARRSVDAAHALRNAIAERIGNPSRDIAGHSDNLGAGQAAQRGVETTLGQDGIKQGVGEGLYNKISIAPDQNATITNSKSALADLNIGLKSNPELSKLIQDGRLLAYERALKGETQDIPTGLLDANGKMMTRPVQKGGALSWQDLKSFRSYIGEMKGRQTLQDSTSQDALGKLYGALSEDMRATAQATNPKALAEFTRANNYWRGLEGRRREVLTPLLGKHMDLNGEAAFSQIQQWATANKGNVFALARTLRSMPPEEAGTVRATIFDRLGNVPAGRNDASGMVFSPNDFVTHWSNMSGRAKSVLFPGTDYRDSIDRLVSIASSQKGAQQYSNISKTGNAINGAALLTGFFTNPLATLPVALGQVGFGKVMSSPRFANWLASSVRKPNAVAALAHINRLSSIAKAEPAIANEVLQLQQRLASAFTGSSMPTRLAAQEPSNETDGGQGNAGEQQPQNESFQP